MFGDEVISRHPTAVPPLHHSSLHPALDAMKFAFTHPLPLSFNCDINNMLIMTIHIKVDVCELTDMFSRTPPLNLRVQPVSNLLGINGD